MGILTDFIIAKDEEINSILQSDNRSKTWSTLEQKGVDTVKISKLYSIAKNEEYDMDIHYSFEEFGEEEGPWIFKFSDDLLNTIGKIEPSDIDSIASKWSLTEELQMDGWNISDAKDFIQDLVNHSKKALNSNSKILLWVSL